MFVVEIFCLLSPWWSPLHPWFHSYFSPLWYHKMSIQDGRSSYPIEIFGWAFCDSPTRKTEWNHGQRQKISTTITAWNHIVFIPDTTPLHVCGITIFINTSVLRTSARITPKKNYDCCKTKNNRKLRTTINFEHHILVVRNIPFQAFLSFPTAGPS